MNLTHKYVFVHTLSSLAHTKSIHNVCVESHWSLSDSYSIIMISKIRPITRCKWHFMTKLFSWWLTATLFENCKYFWQSITSSWIWAYGPGQHMDCFVICKHFGKPTWSAQSCLSRFCLWFVGIISFVPLRRRWSSMVISSQKFQ